MNGALRVLVVDDSPTMRELLCRHLLGAEGLQVVGAEKTGAGAVQAAQRLRPDVVLLDFELPDVDGLAVAEQIMERAASRILIVTARPEEKGVFTTRALAAGALEVIDKPWRDGDARPWLARLVRTIRLMAEVPVVQRRSRPGAEPWPTPLYAVGLVASTGGPEVLAKVLAPLPVSLGCSVFVAQHMTPGSLGGLLEMLGGRTRLPVREARAGARALPGHVYLAPAECDLEIGDQGEFVTPPLSNGFFTSGDRLLTSLAQVYGAAAAGFVLTGMGEDGALGLEQLRLAGGDTGVQARETCVVAGMPSAALRKGATRASYTPDEIAQRVLARARPH